MPSLTDAKLAFIGGGNMASAIIGGLLEKGVAKSNITVSEPWDVNRKKIAATGVHTTTSNHEASTGADLIVLAVKPQVAKTVCEELAKERRDGAFPIVVSIAAGVTMGSIKGWLEGQQQGGGKSAVRVVRVMPNTPALVGEGASGLFASESVTTEDRQLVDAFFKSVSPATEWVGSEELLDVVTGLSGKCLYLTNLAHVFSAATDIDNSRFWTSVLLRHGRASHCERSSSWTARRTGDETGQADVLWRGQDAGAIDRGDSSAASQECD
jgi:pyrroline-5-carboxylate reductase